MTSIPGGTVNQSELRNLLDRSAIDDLHSRYLFALGWQDADGVAATFTEYGVLHWAGGVIEGREAIRAQIERISARFSSVAEAQHPLRPARLRHFVTNKIIQIDGDRARTLAFWFEIDNDNRHRWPYVGGYGHYEDSVVRTEQGWLFERRTIFNEALEERKGPGRNPAR